MFYKNTDAWRGKGPKTGSPREGFYDERKHETEDHKCRIDKRKLIEMRLRGRGKRPSFRIKPKGCFSEK